MKYILILILAILLVSCGVVPHIQNIDCRVLLIGAGDYAGCNSDLTAPSGFMQSN